MTQVQVASIFTIEIDGKPTIAFEARNMAEARELCKEQWLLDDLSSLKSEGTVLFGAGASLAVRRATESETRAYKGSEQSVQASDDLVLAYLVDLDGVGSRGW